MAIQSGIGWLPETARYLALIDNDELGGKRFPCHGSIGRLKIFEMRLLHCHSNGCASTFRPLQITLTAFTQLIDIELQGFCAGFVFADLPDGVLHDFMKVRFPLDGVPDRLIIKRHKISQVSLERLGRLDLDEKFMSYIPHGITHKWL